MGPHSDRPNVSSLVLSGVPMGSFWIRYVGMGQAVSSSLIALIVPERIRSGSLRSPREIRFQGEAEL